MSNELAILQNELTVARQQNEIMQLRFELQKAQAQKTSRLEDSLFAPALYPHYQKVAETLAKSSVIPTIYRNKPEDIFVAMAMGYQLGFPVEQSLQDIAVINGRPCLWGDGLLSLALNHPECQSIKEDPLRNPKGEVIGYQCTVIRKGHEPHTKQFTLQDASVAGLFSRGTVWKSYPERMLQMRARSLALRDKFADALRGLRIAEVEEDEGTVIEAQYSPVEGSTQTEKLKQTLKVKKSKAKKEELIEDNADFEEMTNQEPDQESVQEPQTESDGMATQKQIDEIVSLMADKGFSEERIKKAMDYYKVDQLYQLTNLEANAFIEQLQSL